MDDDILDLLKTSTPENVDDLTTIESLAKQLEDVYSEMKDAIDKEEKKKIEKLKKKLIGPLVGLFLAGYSETMIRRVMEGIGYPNKYIDELVDEALNEVYKREHHTKLNKFMKSAAIVVIIALLVLVYVLLFSTTKPVGCHTIGCSGEMLNCTQGKYTEKIGGVTKEITIQKSGNQCLVSIRITKSKDPSLIGKYLNCEFKMNNGITDLMDTKSCAGSLNKSYLFG